MIITYEGKRYPYELEDITVKQGLKIEKFLGIPFGEFGKALAAGSSLEAKQALGWLVLEAGDLDKPIGDCDFKVFRLSAAIDAAFEAEAAAEKAAQEAAGPRPTAGTSSGRPEANGAAPPPALSSAAAS